jgi:hypothetical protein
LVSFEAQETGGDTATAKGGVAGGSGGQNSGYVDSGGHGLSMGKKISENGRGESAQRLMAKENPKFF